MDVEVTDNPDKARFEIVADGELAGFAQYHLRDGVIAFTHTADRRPVPRPRPGRPPRPGEPGRRPASGTWWCCPTARS